MNRFEKVFQQPNLDSRKDVANKPETKTNLPPAFIGNPAGYEAYQRDPRPDLGEDHDLWVKLLWVAKKENILWDVFHALRSGGARLRKDKDFGLVILPGEWEQTQYYEFKAKHLSPNKGQVVKLLKDAANLKEVPAPKEAPSLDGWPEESVMAEKHYGYPARLYPFLNQMVTTPKGEAKLLQVFQDCVTVHYPGDKEVASLPPNVVISIMSQLFATSKKEAV